MKKLLALTLMLALVAPALALADTAKPVLLVVSFGTSYNDTRAVTIEAIENKAREAFPDYEVRRAFTSQIIIDKLAKRDNLVIDNVPQAMERLVKDGVKDVVVQPTHVMNGAEYDEMTAALAPYADKFASFKVGSPLLTAADDYKELIAEITAELPKLGDGEAVVFMGHGTHHFANITYAGLEYVFKQLGHNNVFIGTVEGYPTLDEVIQQLEKNGVKKVYLLPLMIVAGDHASNDMAGDEEDSWKVQLKAAGYEVEPILKGLGEYKGIQEHFVRHIQNAITGPVEAE